MLLIVCVHSPTSPPDSCCVYPKNTNKSEDAEVCGPHCMVNVIPDVGIILVTHMRLLCLETLCLFEFVAEWKRYLVSDAIMQARSRQREVPCLTLRRLMSYIYGAPILDVSRSHTTTQHSR